MPADRASNAGDFVRRELAGQRFAQVRWVAQTGSTNSDAMGLARDGAPEGIVVVADHQTRGRGRQGRSWVAPAEASLLVSVLLRPPAPLVGGCAMAVGLALLQAVEQQVGPLSALGLKWPNDLVLADRKLAGILAEVDWPAGTTASGGWRAPSSDERLAVVVGVGINVNWPDGPPDELAEIAVALDQVVGHPVDRPALLVELLRRLDTIYGQMVATRSTDLVLRSWRDRSATLGRRVRVDLGTDDVEGLATDITEDGRLVVDTLEGERRILAVGDVVHLRAH